MKADSLFYRIPVILVSILYSEIIYYGLTLVMFVSISTTDNWVIDLEVYN